MALKKAKLREILSKAGVDNEHLSEAVDEITDGHLTSINALQEEIATLKEQNSTLTEQVKDFDKVQKELDELKSSNENDPYKVKYEKIKEDFENFKTQIEAEKITANKEKQFTELLKECGVKDKYFSTILKVSKFDDLELDENGVFAKKDEITKNIKDEWADFIGVESTKGASVANPPANSGSGKTKEEIMAIKDTAARQKAMAENAELFGI